MPVNSCRRRDSTSAGGALGACCCRVSSLLCKFWRSRLPRYLAWMRVVASASPSSANGTVDAVSPSPLTPAAPRMLQTEQRTLVSKRGWYRNEAMATRKSLQRARGPTGGSGAAKHRCSGSSDVVRCSRGNTTEQVECKLTCSADRCRHKTTTRRRSSPRPRRRSPGWSRPRGPGWRPSAR